MGMDKLFTKDDWKMAEVGVGWKRFEIRKGKLTGDIVGGKIRPIGKWLDERDYRPDPKLYGNAEEIYSLYGRITLYQRGWHIYVRSFGEVFYSNDTRIVLYRQPVAEGYWDETKVVAAKQIKILSRKDSLRWLEENYPRPWEDDSV